MIRVLFSMRCSTAIGGFRLVQHFFPFRRSPRNLIMD